MQFYLNFNVHLIILYFYDLYRDLYECSVLERFFSNLFFFSWDFLGVFPGKSKDAILNKKLFSIISAQFNHSAKKMINHKHSVHGFVIQFPQTLKMLRKQLRKKLIITPIKFVYSTINWKVLSEDSTKV